MKQLSYVMMLCLGLLLWSPACGPGGTPQSEGTNSQDSGGKADTTPPVADTPADKGPQDEGAKPPAPDVSATPVSIETTLNPASAPAGSAIDVVCQVTDSAGNVKKTEEAALQINPSDGVQVNGLKLVGTKVGTYQVACKLGSLIDDSPATLGVTAGLPARMEVTLDPEKPFYKAEETILFERKVYDKFDNELPNVQVKLLVTPDSSDIDKSGYPDSVAFKKDGLYEAKIVVDGKTFEDKPIEKVFPLRVDGTGPNIEILSPKRASMLTGSESITIKGKVTDTVSEITSLKINGVTVSLDQNNEFTTIMKAAWGLNLITAESTDKAGNTGYRSQSFIWSDTYKSFTGPRQPKAFITRLNQPVIDDGNRSTLDDLASILEKALNALDIDSYVPQVLVAESKKKVLFTTVKYSVVKNGKVTMGPRAVTLTPVSGGLKLSLSVKAVSVPVKAKTSVADKSATIVGDTTISGELGISFSNGKAVVTVRSVSANVDKIKVKAFSGILDFLNGLVTSALRGTIKSSLESAIRKALPEPIADFLNGFKLNSSFELPSTLGNTKITLDSGLDTIAFDSKGATLGLAARLSSTKGIADGQLGTPIRTMTPPTWDTSAYAFGASFSQNFLNELFAVTWYAGALSVDMTDKLSVKGTDKLPIDPTGTTLKLTALLPPLVSRGTKGRPIDFAVGDLFVELSAPITGLGKVDVKGYLTAQFGANIAVNAQNEITFTLDFNPSIFAIDIVSIKGFGSAGDLGEISKVLQTIAPEISQFLSAAILKNLPLPELDLKSLAKYGIPPNTVLKLSNGKVDAKGDHFKITGDLK